MIDYATWCAIRDGIAQHLTPTQLADSLGLDVKTVRHWADRPYARRVRVPRSSKLDPFKGRIVGWLDAHALTAQQVFQRLCDAGYDGGISIVKDYVRTIRPRPRAAFLTLAFAPGEMAQVDWGEFGTIAVGNTRRRLSFFVMVLAYSRQLYVEFTLAQTMEHSVSGVGGLWRYSEQACRRPMAGPIGYIAHMFWSIFPWKTSGRRCRRSCGC